MTEMYASHIKEPMSTIVVRPGNLYGPHDKFTWRESKVVAALIRRALEKQDPYVVWGDGEDLKDFLYIDDFIEGLLSAFETASEFEVMNIASSTPVTIKELLREILMLCEHDEAEIQFDDSTDDDTKAVDQLWKIRLETGWAPKISLVDGPPRTISWYKSFYSDLTPEKPMIISRTPFRISFLVEALTIQRGTENGGMVMSATINKYAYLTVRRLP